jgi:hypothetical protein
MGSGASVTVFKESLKIGIKNGDITVEQIKIFLRNNRDIMSVLGIMESEIDGLKKEKVILFIDKLDETKIKMIYDRIIGKGFSGNIFGGKKHKKSTKKRKNNKKSHKRRSKKSSS